MSNHRFGRRPEARVELKLVPLGNDTYEVRTITRADRYTVGASEYGRTHGGESIGKVRKGESGAWLHSEWPNVRLGPIYGHSKTKEKAAQECYRSYRAWIGF